MDYSFQELLDLAIMFRDAEVLLEKTISLLSKLPEQYQLVENLLLYSDSVVRTDEEQNCIYRLFGFGKKKKIIKKKLKIYYYYYYYYYYKKV